uniref:Uncharacterized protein n=1 Tax=Romanomermis culicivorax TaxID=13658 RepID=A0A915KG21_ROMCU
MPADDDTPASWLLEVIGKGNKQRFVPISDECNASSRCSNGMRAVHQSVREGGMAMKRNGDDFDWS